MTGLLERLKNGDVLICDGATGTFLQARGLKPGECPELWNETRRPEVLDIARSYIAAGADMIETNSFGGTRFKLAHFGLAERAADLNRLAAEIAREAAGPVRLVAASIGPTGRFVEPYGDLAEEEMYAAFREQAVALEAGGADAICIETMSDINEARIAVAATKENTRLPAICTFTFDRQPNGQFRTMMGVSPAQVAREIPAAGADVIGSNCGNGIENMLGIAGEMRDNTAAFIMIQANAGMPVLEGGKAVFKATPEDMARQIEGLLTRGVNVIGGCCGTTPEHIRAMAEAVRAYR